MDRCAHVYYCLTLLLYQMKSRYLKTYDYYGVRVVIERHELPKSTACFVVKGYFCSGLRIYRTTSPYLYENVDSFDYKERAQARWACRLLLLIEGERIPRREREGVRNWE